MGSVVESAISWMERTAADDSHGYSQIYRWGPDYDCSSSVITAWQTNGVPLKTKGASWTGNLRQTALRCGFKDVSAEVNLATGAGLKRGDILLVHNNNHKHTGMYCGSGKEVEASIDENGKTVGRLKGDQTGREFLVRSYRRNYWQYCLRYEEAGTVTTPAAKPVATPVQLAYATHFDSSAKNGVKLTVNTKTEPLMLRTDADAQNGKIVYAIPKGDSVTWYGYYKFSKDKVKWLFVTYKGMRGYSSSEYLK